MILHQRDHAFILGTVRIVMVSLVHQNHRVARHLVEELAHFFLRRNAGGGIVRIADVNQALVRGGQHLLQVMTEAAGKRDLQDFRLVDARVI